MPHYAEFILAFSVNLTIEDLGLLDTNAQRGTRTRKTKWSGDFKSPVFAKISPAKLI